MPYADPARQREYNRLNMAKWRAENRGRVNARTRQRRVENPEKSRGYARAYYERHKDRLRAEKAVAMRARRSATPEYYRAYNKKWREESMDRYLARERQPHKRFKGLVRHAKARGKECSITLDEYISLVSGPCHYCNRSLDMELGASLDRADNNVGYVQGNVLPCCGGCNRVKSDILTPDEMKAAMAAVKQVRLEKALDQFGPVGMY